MSQALDRRLEAALRLGAEAGALALRMAPLPGVATLKGPQDWLTEADGAVERLLSDGLAALFPEDGFQGEEEGSVRGGRLRWVVDPIDGTSNFARGGSRWAVSLGLVEDGAALLGVLVAPALGETYSARQGGGAWLNGARVQAAATASLSRSIVEVGWSPRRPDAAFLALAGRVRAAGAILRAGGSAAVGLAEVAAGRIDAYVELHVNAWDVAGSLVILAEAGARVSPFLPAGLADGAPILAAAPGIADALTEAAQLA